MKPLSMLELEAIDYTRRTYELAWPGASCTGDKQKAKAEAEYARQMSEDMGYYWGQE